MGHITADGLVAIVTGVVVALANYFGLRTEVRVMEQRLKTETALIRQDIAPIVKWWHRMAEDQASRMFLRTRASDRDRTDVANGG